MSKSERQEMILEILHVRNIHADWAVFSARSLTDDGRIYDVHYNETALRKVMLENAEKNCFSVTAQSLEQIPHIINAALPTLIIWSVTAKMQNSISKCILI